MHMESFEDTVCQYLMNGDNFKRIYEKLEKEHNPIYLDKWYGPKTESTVTGVDLRPGGCVKKSV